MKLYTKNLGHRAYSVTIKLDGVQGTCNAGVWTSRNGKPLYNLPVLDDGKYEIYLGDFKKSISAVKTHNGAQIDAAHCYRLDLEYIDERIDLGLYPESDLAHLFEKVRSLGHEGLVVYGDDCIPYKIKDKETIDAIIVDIIEGTGRNKGRLGAFRVDYNGAVFKVGTGLTDKDRVEYYTRELIGTTIEIEGMEILPSGKLRHPRFIQLRPDK